MVDPGEGGYGPFIDEPTFSGDPQRATRKAHYPSTQPPSPLLNPRLGLKVDAYWMTGGDMMTRIEEQIAMLDNTTYKISDFDYDLPQELIAQTPIEPRDASRLLVVHRDSGTFEHRHFRDIGEYLRPGDLLIANQSRVLPARLLGHRAETGGAVEVLLLAERPDLGPDYWETLVRPGRRLREGSRIVFGNETVDNAEIGQGAFLQAEVLERTDAGGRIVRFTVEKRSLSTQETGTRAGVNPAPTQEEDNPLPSYSRGIPLRVPLGMGGAPNVTVRELIERLGRMPLPPYIHETLQDPERYQTVYARITGSAAAPTAGLHFTPHLLEQLRSKGCGLVL